MVFALLRNRRLLIFLAVIITGLYFIMVNNASLRPSAQIYLNGALVAVGLLAIASLFRR